MINDLKALVVRTEATLLQDAIGAVALMVILVGGLHLPGAF